MGVSEIRSTLFEIRSTLLGVLIVRESYSLGGMISVPYFRKPPCPVKTQSQQRFGDAAVAQNVSAELLEHSWA